MNDSEPRSGPKPEAAAAAPFQGTVPANPAGPIPADPVRQTQELQRLNEQLREKASLLDKAQDAILVRDMEHRITYWNKSAERLYGWTAEEAAG